MLRLVITDPEGKTFAAKDVPTAAELLSLVEQARAVIRECERLAQGLKGPTDRSRPGQVPYAN